MNDRRHWIYSAWSALLLGLMTLFVLNIGLMVASVATNSFARRWLGTWLPLLGIIGALVLFDAYVYLGYLLPFFQTGVPVFTPA